MNARCLDSDGSTLDSPDQNILAAFLTMRRSVVVSLTASLPSDTSHPESTAPPPCVRTCRSHARCGRGGAGVWPGFYPTVLRLPAVVGLLRDPVLTAQIRRCYPGVPLFQNGDDLFFAVSCGFHDVYPYLRYDPKPKNCTKGN